MPRSLLMLIDQESIQPNLILPSLLESDPVFRSWVDARLLAELAHVDDLDAYPYPT